MGHKWDTAHVPNQDKLKNGTAINGEQRPALHSRTQTHPTLNLQITHVSGRTKIDGNPDKNVPKTRAYGISQREGTTDRRLRVALCAASAPRRAVRRRKPTAHTCLVPFGSAATPNDAATAMHALSAHVLAQQPVGATKGGPAHAMCGVAAAAAVYMRALEVHKGRCVVWGANHTAQPQKIHQKRHRHKTIQVREKGGGFVARMPGTQRQYAILNRQSVWFRALCTRRTTVHRGNRAETGRKCATFNARELS